MRGDSIYEAVRKRTRKVFGFAINLHRFRHAAATFWSSRDPKNVRGAKDLLGHWSFGTTEKALHHSWRIRASRVVLSLGPLEGPATPRAGSEPKTFRIEMSGPDLILPL